MPDYKDESAEVVAIPDFLKRKWSAEGNSNDPWVNPSARQLRSDREWTPSEYLIAWIAAWVEEFGIDGFRCDIVENVHLYRWQELNEACNVALDKWRAKHPESIASTWDAPFYMTGDFDSATIDYREEYAEAGFQSLVNFYFPKSGDLDAIVYTWQAYADALAQHADWHPFSYLNNSYHRDASEDNMMACATTLLLSPGVVQIFYGDETGRELSDARYNVDSDQAFRSDMNWESVDQELLKHYRKLGKIRSEHPAIGLGAQTTIDVHTCYRCYNDDEVIIRVAPIAGQPIRVAPLFADGTELVDLYSGARVVVTNGTVRLTSCDSNVVILVRL